MNKNKHKIEKRAIRHRRVRAVVSGSAARPRLSVFRSSSHIYVQVIDDESGKTLAAFSSKDIKTAGKKSEVAAAVGKAIAAKAQEKSITNVVFDRGGYAYHGRVKALAEGAREGGLKF